jgi:hypothetical protein
MLVNGVLHRVDTLLEAGIPIILDGIVSSTHQLLGDVAPFLVVLVSENEQHPLLLL